MMHKGKMLLFTVFIIIAIVFVSILPVSAVTTGRTYTDTGGDLMCDNVTNKYLNGSVTPNPKSYAQTYIIYSFYKGEKIKFPNTTGRVRIDGPYSFAGGLRSSFGTRFMANTSYWNTEGKYEGCYRFSDNTTASNGYFGSGDYQGWLSLDTHTFRLDLEPTDKTYDEGTLNLSIESNNKEAGFMKFSIESGGHSIRDIYRKDIHEALVWYEEERKFNISKEIPGAKITLKDIHGINVTEEGNLMLNMSGLDVEEGRYTIVLEDPATEVLKKINFEIVPREIEIDVKDEISKGEKAEIIVESAFSNKKARLLIDGDPEEVPVPLNDEGEKMFRWDTKNISLGRHEVRIQVDVDGDGEFEGIEDEEASCYIEVIEGEVTVEAPDKIFIGDPVMIKGTSMYGDYAVILIDDKYKNKAMIYRNKFEYEYKTVGETEGTKKVEVFIDAPIEFGIGDEVSEEWKRENKVDADTEFTLIESHELTLDIPQITAEGDDIWINGTAIGTDNVYLLVLNYKGEVVFPYDAKAIATSVDEAGKWNEKLIKPNVGTYTVIVLHKGRDGMTDAIPGDKWVIGEESKTLEQRIAIVEDRIKEAGSDDVYIKKTFKVVNPEVKLRRNDVAFGEKLIIVADTNVKEGVMSWVTLRQRDKEIKKTAEIENGTIIAEFDTAELSLGRWDIIVNIPDRCSDEGEVNIYAATAKPSPPASVTTSPTTSSPIQKTPSTNTSPKNKQVPGFGSMFAILGFLIVYVYRRLK